MVTSALIVTDPLHSRRSMLCVHRLFKGTSARIIPYLLPLEGFKEKFSEVEDYWTFTIEELLRYSYYWMGFRKG
jgi:hypothetical protein